MKLQRLIKPRGAACIAVMVAAAMLSGGSAMAADTTAPDAQPKTDAAAAPAIPANLSGPTREVVKLSVSGVSEDVIKAYVYHSPSMFNLSADTIIHLKGVGVTADVLAAMLNRDTMLRDQSALNARTGTPPPMVQPTAPPATSAPDTTDTAVPAPDYSVTTPPPATYYYPDYAYDYPYYYYPYGYYGGWYWGGRGWLYGPRVGFGFGRGFGGRPFVGGRGFVGGRSGGGHFGGGGVGRH